jgi:hypothetical protein
MATVDPRLTPLIETLIASGADWLAVEILSEIRMGRVDEHSEEELKEAREAVETFRKEKTVPPPTLETRQTSVRHLSGDEQIEFAANYAVQRITQNIEMAGASLQKLNEIANRSTAHLGVPSDSARQKADIELRWLDTEGTLNRSQTEEARSNLPALWKSLSEWSNSAREGTQNG